MFIVQGAVFFHKESAGTIYFYVTAEIEGLSAIFTFWGSWKAPENNEKAEKSA